MNQLVEKKFDGIYISSDIIAKELNRETRVIRHLIEEYYNHFEDLGVLHLLTQKPQNKKGGRPEKIYYLNEEHFIFLITMMRPNRERKDTVLEFKKRVSREFVQMKHELVNDERTKQESFEKVCRESIENRLFQTGAIKRFIDYCIESGSKGYKVQRNQDGCYATFTEYAYKCYFDNYKDYKNAVKGLSKEEKNLKQNLRNSINSGALTHLSTIETMIANIIDREITKGTFYKDINKIVQKELNSISGLLGTNSITNNELPEKCQKQIGGN